MNYPIKLDSKIGSQREPHATIGSLLPVLLHETPFSSVQMCHHDLAQKKDQQIMMLDPVQNFRDNVAKLTTIVW